MSDLKKDLALALALIDVAKKQLLSGAEWNDTASMVSAYMELDAAMYQVREIHRKMRYEKLRFED